jgi:TPR repeat protein
VYFLTAAKDGNLAETSSAAAFYLGLMYYEGLGVMQDYKVAAKWYRFGAQKNNPWCQCRLARMYLDGLGVDKSPKNGEGTKIDFNQAFTWFCKAATHSDANAEFAVGQCYEEGEGVEENISEAVKWYVKAADLGNMNACKRLNALRKKGIILNS